MFAVGRDACTSGMGLEAAGVQVNANHKITTKNEQTNVPHIYAIGDVIDGAKLEPPSDTTELTPVAIQAGKLLAARLYGEGTATMDYALVPTTVYTPLEYGACGLPEEVAIETYGEANIEVFHSYYKPLEWTVPNPNPNPNPSPTTSRSSGRGRTAAHPSRSLALALTLALALALTFTLVLSLPPTLALTLTHAQPSP